MLRISILMMSTMLFCASPKDAEPAKIVVGAERIAQYLPLIAGKKIGLTVNHSSLVKGNHLTDTLLALGLNVAKVYTPEHGFRGTESDGAFITYDSAETAFELISIYGKNKKPSPEQLQGIEIMLFDIQDVGTRFFTYISTMHYVMEACAENDIPVIILDRPNPNGSYVDGPVRDSTQRSFVGMHPIPIVHGMTVGELAQMINGEGWLANSIIVDLEVIPMRHWEHTTTYSLPIKPSPNLPNDLSIALYPSLCLFEGTMMSVGRGTDNAFLQIGHPNYPDSSHSFTPVSRPGAKWPPLENEKCFGISWIDTEPSYELSISTLIDVYNTMNDSTFFNSYFQTLAGTDQLEKQIKAGMSEAEIKATWKPELDQFRQKRLQYLIYE